MNFRSRFNYAMSVIRNNSTPYIVGAILLISGLLCSLFARSWIAALCVVVAYLIYALCVDYTILKKMGYFPSKEIKVEVDDEEWEDECGSVYEGEIVEDEEYEDEEDLYQGDDDVEEEYEDENYNEDEDEFDFEEDIDEFEFEENIL